MRAHLSDDEASRLLSGALQGDELSHVEEHLWRCSLCRDALQQRTEPTADLPLPPPSDITDGPPVVPGYEIVRELGRGGMGIVYEARQLRPRRTVALKVLRAGLPADVEARRRFRAESEALAQLHHPGIVQVYEVGEAAGRPYFSLEYCAGGSLASRLATGPLPPTEAAALVEAVARAIAVAHRAGIVHRDLKPGNILLTQDQGTSHKLQVTSKTNDGSLVTCNLFLDTSSPKVTDFGLAKTLARPGGPVGENHTATGFVLGTPAYVAPEQVEGTAGPAADVYALGAILYECLTGRPPFRAATVLETLDLVRTREPVPVRQSQPGVPRDLETICLKCLQKEPARRYASAEALAADLERVREGRPILARPVSSPERLGRWARRNPLAAGLATVLGLALVVGLAVALGLWANAAWHLRQEEAARREAEANYLACRQLLGEYVAITRDPRLQTRDARHAQREALLKARAFCEELARRRPDDADARRHLAGICTNLATLGAYTDRLDEARKAAETARALWQELSDAAPDDAGNREGLAASLQCLGLVYSRLGAYAPAERALRQAIQLWEQLADEGAATGRALRDASNARRDLTILLDIQGRHEEVKGLFEERSAHLARLAAAGDVPPELRLEQLWGLTILGEVQQPANPAAARRSWEQAREVGRRVVAELPENAVAWFFLGVCTFHIAETSPADQAPEEVAQHFTQATQLLEAEWRRGPGDRITGRMLADAWGALARSQLMAGRPGEARSAARRSVEVYEDMFERQPGDPAVRFNAFEAMARLACIEQRCGNEAAARRTATRTADRFVVYCDTLPGDPEALALASRFVATVAAGLRHAGAPEESLRIADRSLRLFEDVCQSCPDQPQLGVGLSEAWTQRAKVLWRLGRHDETEQALRSALQVADRLATRWPDLRNIRDDRRRRLGRFLEDRGRTAEAASYLQGKE